MLSRVRVMLNIPYVCLRFRDTNTSRSFPSGSLTCISNFSASRRLAYLLSHLKWCDGLFANSLPLKRISPITKRRDFFPGVLLPLLYRFCYHCVFGAFLPISSLNSSPNPRVPCSFARCSSGSGTLNMVISTPVITSPALPVTGFG